MDLGLQQLSSASWLADAEDRPMRAVDHDRWSRAALDAAFFYRMRSPTSFAFDVEAAHSRSALIGACA